MWRSCGKPCAFVRVGSLKRGGDRPCARFAFRAENAKGSLFPFSFAGRVLFAGPTTARERPSARSAVRRFPSRPAARLRSLTKSRFAEQISARAGMSCDSVPPVVARRARARRSPHARALSPGLAGLRNTLVYAQIPRTALTCGGLSRWRRHRSPCRRALDSSCGSERRALLALFRGAAFGSLACYTNVLATRLIPRFTSGLSSLSISLR